MRAVNNFRDWFGNLPYTDPIRRRLAPILQGFFIALIGALLLAIIAAFIIIGPSWLTPAAIASIVIFSLAVVGSLMLLRRGYLNWSLGLIIVFLLLNQARTLLTSGFLENQQTLLSSIWPLTLTAFLLGRRFLIFTGVVNFFIVAVIALQERAALLALDLTAHPLTIERLTGFALIIGVFAILLDLIASAFRGAIDASIQREKDLEQEIAIRKQAEKSLAQQREQYRVTLSSIGDAVIATNTAGQIMFINEVAARRRPRQTPHPGLSDHE